LTASEHPHMLSKGKQLVTQREEEQTRSDGKKREEPGRERSVESPRAHER